MGAGELVVLLLAVHLVLFAYDQWSGYAGFLNADRSHQRAEWIANLLNQVTWSGFIATLTGQGVIGDYFFHYLAWLAGGRAGVVLMQVALAIASTVCLYRMLVFLTDSRRLAFGAALLYGLLPHSLAFAHQLSSEAVAVPLTVCGIYFYYRHLIGKPGKPLLLSALFLAAAILVRPILALIPFFLVAVSWLENPAKRTGSGVRGLSIPLLSLAPLLLWGLFVSAASGQSSIGNTQATVPANLAMKIKILAQQLPDAEKADLLARYTESGTTSPGRYLAFVAENPRLVASSALKDAAVFAAKSGASRLTVDYLDLAPNRDVLQGTGTLTELGWRRVWQNEGLLAAIKFVVANAGLSVLAVEAAASLVILALTAGMVIGIGAFSLDREWRQRLGPERRALLLTALSIVALALLSSQILDEFQSRHRFIADFAIVMLAAAGAAYLERRWLVTAPQAPRMPSAAGRA